MSNSNNDDHDQHIKKHSMVLGELFDSSYGQSNFSKFFDEAKEYIHNEQVKLESFLKTCDLDTIKLFNDLKPLMNKPDVYQWPLQSTLEDDIKKLSIIDSHIKSIKFNIKLTKLVDD